MQPATGASTGSRWPIPAAAVGLALLCLLLFWPGQLTGDSTNQLHDIQAGRITDWHSPLMSIAWRAMGTRPEALLIIQVLLYWLGLGLVADALRRESSVKWGLAVLAVGLGPLSLKYLGSIQKDTLFVGFMLTAAGATFRLGRAYGVVPALLALLMRANAVFAVPPLFIGSRNLFRTALLSIALALALIPVARFVNLAVLRAEPSHVEKSLQLFDIAGIERFSGRRYIEPDIVRCYNPFYWDTIELDCQAFNKTPDSLTGRWLKTIAAEPLAYAQHRLLTFNSNIYFLVPPKQECHFVPRHHEGCTDLGTTALLKDAVLRSAPLWPVTWLLVGALLLFTPLQPVARSLVVSALIFGFSHLAFGVASGFRYFFWTEIAVQLAIVWQIATGGIPQWRRIAVALLALWAVCYAYRYLPLVA